MSNSSEADARYVERNPVRAKLCQTADTYHWSSARFHTGIIKKDLLIQSKYEGVSTQKAWKKFLKPEPIGINVMKINFRTGRPLGTDEFLKQTDGNH